MVSINRYEAQNRITNILSEYLSMLKEAEPNKKQLTLETNKLFCNSEKLATILKNNELSTNLYPLLSLDGIKQLYNSCIELARCYELSSYRKYKDACIEYKNIFKIGSSLNSFTAEDSALKVEEGRCVVFKLEQLNDYILQSGENIYYTVEWKKTDSSGKNTSGIINNLIKNNFDDDSRDREFSFDKAGKYKIHADYVQRLYGRSEYRKVIEHNEITVFVVPGDEKIKNMKLQDKYIYAIRYADWDEAICDAKTMAIMLSATALIFGLIALTPIDELMVVMAPIFQAIGIGGAIEEFIKSLYLIADFIDRVNKAQSEAALQEAGDVFAQIIVGLGIAGLSALLNYLSGKAGAKAKERLKANTAEIRVNKTQKKIVGDIKDPKTQLANKKQPHDFTKHGNFGEIVVDVDLESTGHIKRISVQRVTSLESPMHHGIDGLYENLKPPPKYLVVDSKYLSSEAAKAETFAPNMSTSKKTGITQLDNEWIEKNLREQFVDANGFITPEKIKKMSEIRKAIKSNDEEICLRLGAKVDNTGKVTYYKYSSDGKVLKDIKTTDGKTKKVPMTWNKE